MKVLSLFFCFFLMITPIWSQWENLNGPEAGSVYSLDAVNGELWAGTERGIFISRDNGGFWRATNIIPQNHKVYDIFVSGNEILLLTETFDKTTKNYQFQLKYSSDSGKTWDNKNLPAVSFSYPFNYRLSKSSDRFYLRDFSSIYSSSDNGSTWTTIKPNNNPNATASSISVSGDRIVASASNKMYLSSDGGATWSTNGYNPVSGVFVDNDLIIANYKSPDSLLVSNDFGTTWTVQGNGYLPVKRIKRGQDGNLYTYNDSGQVGYSTNNGQSWLYYGITTSPGGAYDFIPTVSNKVLLGQSRGISSYDNTQSKWIATQKGLRASDITVLRYDSLQATLYAGTQYQLFKSQNGGVAWKEIPLVPATSFVLPLKFDVKNDTIVYCQGTNVYKSADGGTNWSLIKDNTSYFNNTYSEIRWLGHEVLLIGDQYVLKGPSNGSSWFGVTDNLNSNDDIDDYYQIGERQYVVTNTAKIFSAIGQSAWSQVYNGNGSLIAPEHLFVQYKGRLWMFGSDKSANHTPPANGFLGSWTTATLGGVPTTAQNKAVQFVSVVSTPDAMIAAAPPYGIYISVDDGANWAATNWGIENFQYTTNLVKGKNAFFLGTKGASVWGRGEALLFRKGRVFLDENGNMAQDSSEAGMANIVIQSSSGYSATTAANGNFNIIVEMEQDTLRAIPLPHMVSIPEFLVASFVDSAYVFALQVTDSIQDLCITGLYEADLRPGFQNRLIYTVQNIGTVTTHAIVTHEPNPMFTYHSTTPSATITDSIFLWDLGPMYPQAVAKIFINFSTNPNVPIGTDISTTGIVPLQEDINGQNNSFTIRQTVVGSYDPNDKQVHPGQTMTTDQLSAGNPLIYNVRFQNTGNYYAEFVTIRDTMDPQLDLSSLRILASSHSMECRIKGINVLEFHFDSIFLQPEIVDEPGSHGYIQFSILPKPGATLGNIFKNSAAIYFDYNDPIITNQVTTEIVLPQSNQVQQVQCQALASLYPNPVQEVLNFTLPNEAPDGAYQICIYNLSEQRVLQYSAKISPQAPIPIRTNNFAAGIYFLEVGNDAKVYVGKFEVVR